MLQTDICFFFVFFLNWIFLSLFLLFNPSLLRTFDFIYFLSIASLCIIDLFFFSYREVRWYILNSFLYLMQIPSRLLHVAYSIRREEFTIFTPSPPQKKNEQKRAQLVYILLLWRQSFSHGRTTYQPQGGNQLK